VPLSIQFISGLPRSGSTLLAAILRQNPRFHAAMSGPLAEMVGALLRSMGASNEYSLFISNGQRQRVLRSIFEAYYAELTNQKLIFDSNRGWCAQLPVLANLFPAARVICCVRNPAWILDSIERRIQANPLERGRLFKEESSANVYTRAEAMAKGGPLGRALQGLRQAWFGEHAGRLIVVRYDALCEQPALVVGELYRLLGEPPFAHDFERVEYAEPEFDARLGMPDFHTVASSVRPNRRTTILPTDIFGQHDHSFWDAPGQNPRGVVVI
jgi:sulfotransferase